MPSLDKEKIMSELLKKALGYDVEEIVEEFLVDEESGKLKKNKRKVSKKHIPPDLPAVKAIFELCEKETKTKYENMTEEELLKEKKRLLNLLKEDEKNT